MERSFMVNFSQEEFKAIIKESVREIMQEITPQTDTLPKILDVKQAAEYLRLKVSTLYEKTSRKLIPHFKKGNKLLFNREELEQWISEGKVKPATEVESDASTYLLNRKKP